MAKNDYTQSFQHYQEIGNNNRAKFLLKLIIFCEILLNSNLNYLDSQEAKV